MVDGHGINQDHDKKVLTRELGFPTLAGSFDGMKKGATWIKCMMMKQLRA